MKSLYPLSEMNTVAGGVHRPQEVEVRLVDTEARTESTAATISIIDGALVVQVAEGASIAILADPDTIEMPVEMAEEIASVLEDARNYLHAHSVGSKFGFRTSVIAADALRRRIDRVLRG